MAGNLLTSDNTALKCYKHSGQTTTITTSMSPSGTTMRGVQWDGTNFLYGSATDIYKQSGFTTTNLVVIAAPSTVNRGIAWDGSNLYSAQNTLATIYKHSGFTTTIITTIAIPATDTSGLDWDGTNLLSSDYTADKLYKHSGFTTTITASFGGAGKGCQESGWDGANSIATDSATDSIYIYTGFSSTVSTSFASPSTGARGCADDSWSGSAGATYEKTVTAKGKIKVFGASKTIQAKTEILDIPLLISPDNAAEETSPVILVWDIPSDGLSRNANFRVQIDKTSDLFDDLEFDKKSYIDSGFEYYNGESWVSVPTTGITSSYAGNQVRISASLTTGTKYWKVTHIVG